MEEGAGEKEMVLSVNVLKDTLVNAVKTVRNYKFISCIKYSKLSYYVDVTLGHNVYLPSFCTAFFQAFTENFFGDVSETNGFALDHVTETLD